MTTTGPVEGVVAHGGFETAWLDWGGVGPSLVLLHPNGFCAGMYDPLARRLTDRFRVVGVDLRGHGASTVVTDELRLGNDAMAGDVLAVLDHLGMDRCRVLGVSLGGGVAIEVAVAAPDRVEALLLCEAIAVPRPEDGGAGGSVAYWEGEHPLAVGARRRRVDWDDRAGVVASYGARPPLDAVDPEVLSAYVRWGFADRDDGRVELACHPETEAQIFGSRRRHGPVATFRRLADVRCPAVICHGDRTDIEPRWFAAQGDVLGVVPEVFDGGHFFLFEDLDRAEALVRRHLG